MMCLYGEDKNLDWGSPRPKPRRRFRKPINRRFRRNDQSERSEKGDAIYKMVSADDRYEDEGQVLLTVKTEKQASSRLNEKRDAFGQPEATVLAPVSPVLLGS